MILRPPAHQRHKLEWPGDEHLQKQRADGEKRRLRATARMKEIEAERREDKRRLAQFNCVDRRHTGFPQTGIYISDSRCVCPTCGRLL